MNVENPLRILSAMAALALGPWVCGADDFLGVSKDRINSIIDRAYDMDPMVEQEFIALKKEYPDSPVPGFMYSIYLYSMQSHAEKYGIGDTDLSERYEKEAVASLSEAKAYAKTNNDSLEAAFVVAMSELSLAKYYVEKEKWFAGFWKTRSGLKGVRRILKRDPELHDAKMALGMANCYLSEVPGYIKPFAALMRFSGDMEKGLEYMEEAKKGMFTRVDAAYNLAEIQWFLRGEPRLAYGELVDLVGLHPENLEFQFLLGQCEFVTSRKAAGARRYEEILNGNRIERFPKMRSAIARRLGSYYGETRDFEKAVAMGELLIEISALGNELAGLSAWGLLIKGDGLRGLGREDEAVQLYRSIEKKDKRAFEEAAIRLQEIEVLDAKRRAEDEE
ncbi:MAG: hypothetical protein AAGB46_18230 [Verrucomicrobiota bacterium]